MIEQNNPPANQFDVNQKLARKKAAEERGLSPDASWAEITTHDNTRALAKYKAESGDNWSELAIPDEFQNWREMDNETLETVFFNSPEKFQRAFFRFVSQTETNIQWFLSKLEERDKKE